MDSKEIKAKYQRFEANTDRAVSAVGRFMQALADSQFTLVFISAAVAGVFVLWILS